MSVDPQPSARAAAGRSSPGRAGEGEPDDTPPVESVRLECPHCRPAAVDEFVAGLAGRAGLTDSRAYWLRLAADEITTNIGQHGYRGRGGVLYLSGAVEPGRVWIRIEDEAPAFDPRTHRTAVLDLPPAERPLGGYGLLLAMTNLDDFDYEYAGGRNRNTLIMYRPPPDAQERGT